MTLPWTGGLVGLIVGMLYATACLARARSLYRRTKHMLVPHCVEEHDGDWYLRNLDTGEAQLLIDGAMLVVPQQQPKDDERL